MSLQTPENVVPSAPPTLITYTQILLVDRARSDRMQAGKLQARALIPARSDVEALHGVARTTLDQIIERRDDDQMATVRRQREADIAEIGPTQDLRLRQAIEAGALLHQPDERLNTI